MSDRVGVDPFDVRRARGARGLLRDVQRRRRARRRRRPRRAAARRLAGEDDEAVLLAAALAVRGPRLGHVCVDLATIRETATVDAEEPRRPRGAALARRRRRGSARLAASPLVAVGEDGAGEPGRCGSSARALYLDRYWREERQVAADLLRARPSAAAGVDDGRARRRARAPVRGEADDAASALRRRRPPCCAASPSSPAARARQDDDRRPHRRAARRAGRGRGRRRRSSRSPRRPARPPRGWRRRCTRRRRRLDVDDAVRDAAARRSSASTLHRLLGWRPGSHSRFRHDRGNRLPHDVVIVDETSMVSLSLMARLVEAVRPDGAARPRRRPRPAHVDRGRRGARRHRRPAAAARRRARSGRRRLVVLEPASTASATGSSSTLRRFGGDRGAGDARRARVDALRAGARRRHVDRGRRRRPARAERSRRSATARSPPRRAVIDAARAGDARAARSRRSAPSACCARTAAARTASRTWTARDRALARRRGRRLRRRRRGTSAARCS